MQVQQLDVWRQSRRAASRFYRAAIEPDPLSNWAKIFWEITDGLEVNFTLMGPTGKAEQIGTLLPRGEEHREFVAHYQYINPLNRYWQVAPEGKIIRFDNTLIDETCIRSEFYNRYREYLDARDGVCMVLGEGRPQKVLVHMRVPPQTDAAERWIMLLESLADDLLASFDIAGAFLNATNTLQCVIDSLDEEGVGMAILSSDGRIENANGSMTAMLDHGDVLRLDQGRLASAPTGTVPPVSDLIRRTAHSGVLGRVRYRKADGAQHGNIVAYPAHSVVDRNVAGEDKIVLLATDSSQKDRRLKDALRGTYRLTAAEMRVAVRLREGNTSRQIATEFGVQPNCIRTHLKSIYAKTGTHSQVELLNFLAR